MATQKEYDPSGGSSHKLPSVMDTPPPDRPPTPGPRAGDSLHPSKRKERSRSTILPGDMSAQEYRAKCEAESKAKNETLKPWIHRTDKIPMLFGMMFEHMQAARIYRDTPQSHPIIQIDFRNSQEALWHMLNEVKPLKVMYRQVWQDWFDHFAIEGGTLTIYRTDKNIDILTKLEAGLKHENFRSKVTTDAEELTTPQEHKPGTLIEANPEKSFLAKQHPDEHYLCSLFGKISKNKKAGNLLLSCRKPVPTHVALRDNQISLQYPTSIEAITHAVLSANQYYDEEIRRYKPNERQPCPLFDFFSVNGGILTINRNSRTQEFKDLHNSARWYRNFEPLLPILESLRSPATAVETSNEGGTNTITLIYHSELDAQRAMVNTAYAYRRIRKDDFAHYFDQAAFDGNKVTLTVPNNGSGIYYYVSSYLETAIILKRQQAEKREARSRSPHPLERLTTRLASVSHQTSGGTRSYMLEYRDNLSALTAQHKIKSRGIGESKVEDHTLTFAIAPDHNDFGTIDRAIDLFRVQHQNGRG